MNDFNQLLDDCPFCGGRPYIFGDEDCGYGVCCYDCNTLKGSGPFGINDFDTPEAAVRAWNRRSDMSEVGDALLDNHPELDILMMVAFPGMISWRTQKKDLPLPLGKIAKRATGDGGGHPMAAGSTISFEAFKDMLTRFMERNFNSKLDFSNLKSSWERKWEEEHKQQKQ